VKKLGVITILIAILVNSIGNSVIAKDNKREFSLSKEADNKNFGYKAIERPDSNKLFFSGENYQKPVDPKELKLPIPCYENMPVATMCEPGNLKGWEPPPTNLFPPQEMPPSNFGPMDKPIFGTYEKEPDKGCEPPDFNMYCPGGYSYNNPWIWDQNADKNKEEQVKSEEKSTKDTTQKQDIVNKDSLVNEPILMSQGDSSPELTLISAELEKARLKLTAIKNTAREQINIKIKETKEKINDIANDKNMADKEKNIKINKLKEELSAKIEKIEENATAQVKDVIDKQNINIESILSYS